MRCASDMMRWAVVMVGVGSVGFGSAARAEPCGNVTVTGMCFDSKTVLFCDGGELQTMTCAAGEICDLNTLFDGAAACVGTRYAGCGDVSENGQCVGNTLLYCEGTRVKERTCADGTTCAWVPEENWYDCVGVPSASTPATPDTSGERRTADATSESDAGGSNPSFAADTASEDTTPPAADDTQSAATEADSGPSIDEESNGSGPTVQKGGAAQASQYAVSGAGCGVGGAPATGILVALLGLVGLVREGSARSARAKARLPARLRLRPRVDAR